MTRRVRVYGDGDVQAATVALDAEEPAPLLVEATTDGHGARVVDASYEVDLDVETESRLRAVLLAALVGTPTPAPGSDRELLGELVASVRRIEEVLSRLVDEVPA